MRIAPIRPMLLVGCCLALSLGESPSGWTSAQERIQPDILRVQQVFADAHRPKRLAADNEFMYVLSGGDHSILVYDYEFRLKRRIGRIGSGPGELYGPEDMSLLGNTVWVADSRNNRVQGFSTDGSSLGSFPVTLPWSIAALDGGLLAVVGRRDEAMMRVFDHSGKLRFTIKDFVATGANPFQTAAFNRGRVYQGSSGTIVYLFRGLLQPSIRWYSQANGARMSELRVAGGHLDEMFIQARERRAASMATGGSGVSGTLNGFALDPATGDMWVAPAAPVIYRYDRNGTKRAEYLVRDLAGRSYGAHDIVITPSGHLLMISSTICLDTVLPH